MPRYWIYIISMAIVTYLIRVLPLTLVRREIKNRTIRSFLYYVPFITLAVMTVPDILNTTSSIWSGAAALLVGVALAFAGGGLVSVSVACCVTVFIIEMFI